MSKNPLIIYGERAQDAARILSLLSEQERNAALLAMAASIEENIAQILEMNARDMQNGRESGLSEALLDRLALTPQRIAGMADGLRSVAALPDPLNRVLSETTRKNGLQIGRVSVPLGVIAVIYEARPNVTADSAALTLKAGSAIILRGGKEAIFSNIAIANALRQALNKCHLPQDAVQLIEDTSRESAQALMTLRGYVDLLIPRGGRGLIRTTLDLSTVPVLETGEGVCHIYVDQDADLRMAADILLNAKVSRPSVCNAAECLLVHQAVAKEALPLLMEPLLKAGVQIRADEQACTLIPEAIPATSDDWGTEYNDLVLAVRCVESLDEALVHIRRYGTRHSEAIITENIEAAHRFMAQVDASAVYHNASTRFTDGGEFGFGAEIGISTQKLHARGPVGLNELTTYKYLIKGSGQTR